MRATDKTASRQNGAEITDDQGGTNFTKTRQKRSKNKPISKETIGNLPKP